MKIGNNRNQIGELTTYTYNTSIKRHARCETWCKLSRSVWFPHVGLCILSIMSSIKGPQPPEGNVGSHLKPISSVSLSHSQILSAVADTICRGITDGRQLLFVKEHSVIWAPCISAKLTDDGRDGRLAWVLTQNGSNHYEARHFAVVWTILGCRDFKRAEEGRQDLDFGMCVYIHNLVYSLSRKQS